MCLISNDVRHGQLADLQWACLEAIELLYSLMCGHVPNELIASSLLSFPLDDSSMSFAEQR